MKIGIAVVGAALLGACAAGLSKEDQKLRDDYIIDEQACVLKARSAIAAGVEKEKAIADGYDCLCVVQAKAGRPCTLPEKKDGGQ